MDPEDFIGLKYADFQQPTVDFDKKNPYRMS